MKSNKLYWLSFASEQEDLGVCIVRGINIIDALFNASLTGCNPGGKVFGIEVPEEEEYRFSDSTINKLLSKNECENYFGEMIKPNNTDECRWNAICDDAMKSNKYRWRKMCKLPGEK